MCYVSVMYSDDTSIFLTSLTLSHLKHVTFGIPIWEISSFPMRPEWLHWPRKRQERMTVFFTEDFCSKQWHAEANYWLKKTCIQFRYYGTPHGYFPSTLERVVFLMSQTYRVFVQISCTFCFVCLILSCLIIWGLGVHSLGRAINWFLKRSFQAD